MKRVEIILVVEAQAQIAQALAEKGLPPCQGPVFENPTDCTIGAEGVYVETHTLDTKEPCMYFYPLHQIARIKVIE